MKTKLISLDLLYGSLDAGQFEGTAQDEEESNSSKIKKIKGHLTTIIKENLTPKQSYAVYKYYFDNWSITEIAESTGTNKSSVCRILQRARLRIESYLQFYF